MAGHHLTLDIDWCSDDTLDYVSSLLVQADKRATWFATHKSAVVDDLNGRSCFEVGIHPNFLDGSSHGSSVDMVLDHITSLFPDSSIMRTHGLYQSSPVLDRATSKYGISVDVSLFLPYHSNLSVLIPMGYGEKKIRRVPYFWEDDIEMLNDYTGFSFRDQKHHCEGLKIYDFHPVHVALNISSFDEYVRLKEKKPIFEWDRKFILKYQKKGKGTLSFFEDMIERIQGEKTISQIVEQEI
ncbi:hypothetical protein [Salidesulfovibrio onnuriiensis]|uniref:polysaccharide deacetylase WbmS family protein n=1 Tax=Salidesulfovibrio onnuriiensis TaxID=2583823 RepID=UPI0011C7BB4A|nr:hypothetical protein [Salidesulfovibrio onnuriiensis]